MPRLKTVPEPILVPLAGNQSTKPNVEEPPELRLMRIEEFFQARALSPNTEKAYRHDLSYFLKWTDKNWNEVTPRQIAQYKSHLMDKGTSGKKVRSDASVRRILGTLQTFYAWLHRVRYVSENPTLAIELPKISEPDGRALTPEQMEQICQAAIDSKYPERNMALISLLSHGLRASEASALNVSDFEEQRVYIRDSKADSKGYVPLDLDAQIWLKQYLQMREASGEIIQDESPLLLSHSPRNAGSRMSYNAIRKLMDKLSDAVGFKLTSHQFRHTFATELVLDGMNPHHIRTIMRQKSEKSFRIYSKMADYRAAEQEFRKHRS